jgi:ubiquinone/menaquinone biosynthesis C-methylase UbiE
MPYAGESFDAITLTDVLEHVADEQAALDEMFRILKPSGRLIITTPHKGLFTLYGHDQLCFAFVDKIPALVSPPLPHEARS